MKTQILLKKCLVVLALFFGLIGMTNLNAQEFTVGDLNYRINDDGVSVTVTGHVDGQSATGELIIPESVNYDGNDYPVTIIGEYAFDRCWGFTGSLNIPNSVTIIGSAAFEYCGGFTGSLMISDNVTTIGDYAFLACSEFNGVLTIGNSVESIGCEAFAYCGMNNGGWESISVDYGNSYYDSRDNCNAIISTIDNILIFGCKHTIIPNTIIEIGARAFDGCILMTLDIPNSVLTIDDYAFSHCTFTSITIPSSVIELGHNPFAGCHALSSIIVDEDNPVYDSRNNCNAIINTQTNELITGCFNTVMLEGITSIGISAFEGCTGLTGDLVIPNSVTTIGSAAFINCWNINGTLTIGNSVISIGDYAFYDCSSITGSLTIGNSVISIGDYAFCDCSSITGSLIIPNSVVSIGECAFHSCSGFDMLIIGNSVNNIGSYAFYGCIGLYEVISKATIPPILGFGEWNGSVFSDINCSTLTVPCGCIQAYENSFWHDFFTTIIEDCSDIAELDGNLASVYPNPTNSIVKIEAENIQNISIYNMVGEMVFESAASGDVFEYDFSNNESGIYLVRVETAQGVVTKRVAVM